MRIDKNLIQKSSDPDKLIVYRAESLDNEIRFYFNDKQYVGIWNCNSTFSFFYDEENDNYDKKIPFMVSIFRLFRKILYFIIILVLLEFLRSLLPTTIYKSFFFHFVILIASLYLTFIAYTARTFYAFSFSLRSKHSAEHMIINFLEHNNRLPYNITELRNCSRFSYGCSTCNQVEKYSKFFVSYLLMFLILFIIEFFDLNCICIFILILIFLVIATFTNDFKILYKNLSKIVCHFIQYFNTTRYVTDEDLIFAYLVAQEWMKIVYPEFL